MKTNKPLSPHLSIYKWQVTMSFSILHRVTGIMLFFGTIALLWWLVFISYAQTPTQHWVWHIASGKIGKFTMILWLFALFHHLCSGIRYLFWGAGIGFGLKTVNITALAVVITTFILTIATGCLIFL